MSIGAAQGKGAAIVQSGERCLYAERSFADFCFSFRSCCSVHKRIQRILRNGEPIETRNTNKPIMILKVLNDGGK